ncbi:hypothetical protein ASPBRDRAFT_150870 [Aspergillus brasiliensis CBS 101740]|uniref:Uncharacterized protein n=1 Tax=Aspergillus brasiliensis (strain CBS 101740 / IMI 381727 / IBT 21946) TaxID=767769 RepID=A0A1L9ULL5_ASPBC|nr:hypothetical protein ASPBRDRAFT_150870 [Aspergillus brasiliensis CBS 101740]
MDRACRLHGSSELHSITGPTADRPSGVTATDCVASAWLSLMGWKKQLPVCISDHSAQCDVIVGGGSHLKFIRLRIVWLDYSVDIMSTVNVVD